MTSFINQALMKKDTGDLTSSKKYTSKVKANFTKIKKLLEPKSNSWGEDEVLWATLNKADLQRKFKKLNLDLI